MSRSIAGTGHRYKVHGGFFATYDDSTIIVHPIHHPITMVRPSPVTSVKKNPSALANDDDDAESGPLWRVWDTRQKKRAQYSSIAGWTFNPYLSI